MIRELYPIAGRQWPLQGLYLAEDIRAETAAGRPLVYTNFITSIDGRIAVADGQRRLRVPPEIANSRDWQLFLELAAQADVLLTSGRYLREFAAGKAQDILNAFDADRHGYLAEWRRARGLPTRPAIAIVSASLDFPLPEALAIEQRAVLAFAGERHDRDRAEDLRARGVEVLSAGEGTRAQGETVIQALTARGHRAIYAVTGPQVLLTLLTADRLHRLYLTQALRLLGDEPKTLLPAASLPRPVDLDLRALYLDPQAPPGTSQLLSSFEVRTGARTATPQGAPA